MDRNELLNYLQEKRNATAGVANAQANLSSAKRNLSNVKDKWHKTILWVGGLGIAFIILPLLNGTTDVWPAVLMVVIAAGLKYWKQINYVKPAEDAVAQKRQELDAEYDSAVYKQGMNGFPKKFYNYADIYRLWNLVNENRATTLQDAFNLLETQQFQEDQMEIQRQIRAAQEDIAANARIAAQAAGAAAAAASRPQKVEVSGTVRHTGRVTSEQPRIIVKK